MGFTKLFSSILDSTIWQEDPHVKIVWITLLAMSDRDGVVESSVPGLARRANVTLPQAEHALERLHAPDPYSRTKEHEGRRITGLEEGGGWLILNHEKYRAKMDAEEQRRKAAERQQRKRDRKKASDASRNVTHDRDEVTPGCGSDDVHHAPSPQVRQAEADQDQDQTLSLGSESSPSGLPDPGTSVRADLDAPPPSEPPPGWATEMPPGWSPGPEPELDREAAKLGVDLNLELVKLRAAGERRVDWQQRWRVWLGHAITFARKQQPAAPNPDRAARAAAGRRAAEDRESAERARRDAKAVADRDEVTRQAQLALATLRGAG